MDATHLTENHIKLKDLLLDVLLDHGQGVAGAGDHAGNSVVEHGYVVVIVAGGEAVVGGQAEQARQLGQGAALAVAGVGKAQIHAIPLVAHVGGLQAVLVDHGADLVQFLIGAGSDAQLPGVALQELSLGLGFDHGLHMVQEGLVIADEPLMGFACLLVPGPVVGPAGEEAGLIDLALLGDDEVRLLEDAVLRQALQRLAQAASGVDHPRGPLLAQQTQRVPHRGVKFELAFGVHQRAVEIETEDEAKLGGGHGRRMLHAARRMARRGKRGAQHPCRTGLTRVIQREACCCARSSSSPF